MNNFFDRLTRANFKVHKRLWPAFQTCGLMGLILAVAFSLLTGKYLGLSAAVILALACNAAFTFFSLVMMTKIVTDEENIIYYHHEIAVLVNSAVLLWLLSQPILPYLDLMILGVGMFLACGRVGCLMVGCCHGRPYHWGVSYREEHVEAGFTSHLAGVRLFPVQALESAWVLCIVVTGTVLILNGHTPGAALAWYTVSYGIGRFCFEFMRGDAERPYYLGFSQPQWLSAILMALVVGGELHGTLPYHSWHVAATGFLLVSMGATTIRRRLQKTPGYSILHARHIQEVARAMACARHPAKGRGDAFKDKAVPGGVPMGCTSLGIQISTGEVKTEGECIRHYTFSRKRPAMTEETAKVLARLILQLKYPSSPYELLGRNQGIFHLLIHQASCNDKPHPRMDANEKFVGSFAVNNAGMNSL